MSDRERFYGERDQRTRQLSGAADAAFEAPVGLRIGPDAASHRAGQIAALALVNSLARVHRTIHIDAPPATLMARSLVPAPDLASAMLATARAIDPWGTFALGEPPATAVSIGVGAQAPAGCTVFVGAEGARATLDVRPVAVVENALLGAGIAACIASSAAFRIAIIGCATAARRKVISAWNISEDEDAVVGPGPLEPLDVGDVWMVGAGAVASAVGYWLREFGVRGRWVVIDGDLVKLHNTNRSLLFFPSHSAWNGAEAAMKARVVADAFGADAYGDWLDVWNATNPGRPDVILPLANERGARSDVAAAGLEIVLHATTSGLGGAQLHRHAAGVDGCITCRMRETEAVVLGCSTSPVTIRDESTDAALPFMSATAGLLLVAALYRLQQGELLKESANQSTLDLLSPHRVAQRVRRACVPGCASTLPQDLRDRLNVGRRWARVS